MVLKSAAIQALKMEFFKCINGTPTLLVQVHILAASFHISQMKLINYLKQKKEMILKWF